jgi:hypothetical protein
MNPRADRRLILLVLCAMLLLLVAVLSLAPRVIDGSLEDGAEPSGGSSDAFEPPGYDEEDTVTEPSRGDGLGEPDEVYEDFESEPVEENK